jgi:hypothetical protein
MVTGHARDCLQAASSELSITLPAWPSKVFVVLPKVGCPKVGNASSNLFERTSVELAAIDLPQ